VLLVDQALSTLVVLFMNKQGAHTSRSTGGDYL